MRLILHNQEIYKKEKRLRSFWRKHKWNLGLVGAILGGGLSLFLFSLWLMQMSGLSIKNIEVRGELKESKSAEIIKISGVSLGENLMSISLKKVRQNILTHPWVKDVSVRRYFPDALWISIAEYQPRALLLLGKFYFVSKEGVPFKTLDDETVRDLPILTGLSDRDSTKILGMLAVLDSCEKGPVENLIEVSEIHFHPIKGFSVVTLKKPMEIYLGFDRFDEKLARLKTILENQSIFQRRVATIDLNFKEKVYIRYKI